MTKRGGFTLVELLVVISVLAIILPMAGGTVFFLLRAQSRSAETLGDAMAITQLSHSFRDDVHAARAARTPADAAGCVLEMDNSHTILYHAEANGFVSRIVRRGEAVERREQFRIGAARPTFALSEAGREVAVTIAPRTRSSALADDATTSAPEFASPRWSGAIPASAHRLQARRRASQKNHPRRRRRRRRHDAEVATSW